MKIRYPKLLVTLLSTLAVLGVVVIETTYIKTTHVPRVSSDHAFESEFDSNVVIANTRNVSKIIASTTPPAAITQVLAIDETLLEEDVVSVRSFQSKTNNKLLLWENLVMTQSFATHLQSLSQVPKNIHLCWNDRDLLSNNATLVRIGVASLAKTNPTWTFTIHNDSDVETYLQAHLTADDYELVRNKHIVEKSDLWRLLIMYNEGGYYQDVDRGYTKGPLEAILNGSKMMLPMWQDHNFAQDVMCSAPGNRIFKTAIQLNLGRRRKWEAAKNWPTNPRGVVLALGPATFFHAATREIFGAMLEPFGGGLAGAAERMRSVINNSTHMVTIREYGNETHCESITSYFENCKALWSTKGKFLAGYKKKTWDSEMPKKFS
eukprot:m.182692 g.182692  ORF g.182692 m.182692 type:complete len:377 (-) comp32128_c0_seq2:244-1374(-)